jgi:methyltransferase (TIGR00027 family)
MQWNKASYTAQHMAQIRAAHQVLDTPLVLNDPVAVTLAGVDGMAAIRAGGIGFDSRGQRTLRAFAVARSRVVEDELELAVKSGIRQFVILGAGLDTFAYRNPHANQGLKVFEVDHPDTQTMKRERLAAMAITPPSELTFVPVNFEIDKLDERLQTAGFEAAQPALFSWLGVSMYLPAEAIQSIFQYVKTTAPGSSIVFDYIVPLSSTPFATRVGLNVLACLLALKGEPWRTFFDPSELSELLKSTGFRRMDDMDWHAINARFFDGRTDGLRVGGPGHIMVART